MQFRLLATAAFAACLAACGDGSNHSARFASDASESSVEDASPDAEAGDVSTDAGDESAEAGDESAEAGADAAPVDLPPDSREFDGVVNLVDSDAADQLDTYMQNTTLVPEYMAHGLDKAVNLFLAHYPEEVDFLYFFTDHAVPSGPMGAFRPVNRPAEPGGNGDIEIRAPVYRSTGRLKGVIGLQYIPGFYGPFAHETAHFWANQLDARFGFNEGLSAKARGHWGFSSVHGQLGGFDWSTVRCEDPAGASPPGCNALPSGRTRYVVGTAFPQGNAALEYAPLELYLMGLAPASEVPATLHRFTQAELDGASLSDADDSSVVVEADGIADVAFADIVARHGTKASLPESERHFKAAFVVISKQPASDALLADIANFAKIFGGRMDAPPGYVSFSVATGGRASMDTLLGQRRSSALPLPEPRAQLECSALLQDCPRPELACNGFKPGRCVLSGGQGEGTVCEFDGSCAPGLDCVSSSAHPDVLRCEPYCDLEEASSPLSCQACAHSFLRLVDGASVDLGAICLPE